MKEIFRKRFLRLSVASILTATLSMGGGQALAHAEDFALDEYALDNIVVTATKTPSEELKANANITVIKGETLEKRHYKDLSEALRDVPGVSFNQYAPAGYEPSNSIYLNGANNVVVIVDGVRQNYAGGTGASLTSALKSLTGIERVEVLRGSASTLYGSDAKGGVINIITKKAQTPKSTLGMSFGSYDKNTYSAMTEGSNDSWDWRFKFQQDESGTYKDAHGMKIPSKLSAKSFGVNIGKELAKDNYLSMSVRTYEDNNYYFDISATEPDKKIKYGDVDQIALDLKWQASLGEKTKNQLMYGRSKYAYNVGWGPNQIWTTKASDQLDSHLGDHLFTLGFDFTKDETKGIKKNILNRSLYLQDQWGIAKNLLLTAGIRHDNSSGFGKHNSPSVSLGLDVSPMTHMYLSYNGYFIAPRPLELYGEWGGNPNLKPETGNTKEVGINHDFGDGLTMHANYFKRHSNDRIGLFNYQFRNVGDEEAHGWSLDLAKKMGEHFGAHVGFNKLHVGATDSREENVDGYLPKRQLNIGLDYQNRDLSSSLFARGIFDRKGVQKDPLGAFFPATNYWVVDLSLNYKAEKHTNVYLKVNNIFNKFYAEHSNARKSWWNSKEGQWYTAPGRHFVLGVEESF